MYFLKNFSIEDFLIHATHVLAYLLATAEAQSELERFGYPVYRLQEGQLLLDQVKATHSTIQLQQAKQKDATDALHEEWKQAKQHYLLHLFAARRVLGRSAQAFLQANSTTYAQQLAQASAFYKAMVDNPNYQENLATLNIQLAELAQASQLIEQIVARKTEQTQSRSNVRSATQVRDLRYAEAKRWFKELMAVARVAFSQQPALLAGLRTLTTRNKGESKTEKTTQATTPANVSSVEKMAE